jgi:hypothetical protein
MRACFDEAVKEVEFESRLCLATGTVKEQATFFAVALSNPLPISYAVAAVPAGSCVIWKGTVGYDAPLPSEVKLNRSKIKQSDLASMRRERGRKRFRLGL